MAPACLVNECTSAIGGLRCVSVVWSQSPCIVTRMSTVSQLAQNAMLILPNNGVGNGDVKHINCRVGLVFGIW
jgi:hypothetical protein